MLFWGRHITVWCSHTFPFLYLYILPEDGRMESRKHVVVEATQWTYCVQMLCLCGFKSLLKQYWSECVTEFGLVHSEQFVRFVCNSVWPICRFFISVALYIIVQNKDLKLMSSTHCQAPVFFVCCPTDIFYTKLQTNNCKPCAWFRLFQKYLHTDVI